MRTVKDVKILQMMPAQGWYAEYAEPTGNVAVPLAGWALVEFSCLGKRQRAVWGLAKGFSLPRPGPTRCDSRKSL